VTIFLPVVITGLLAWYDSVPPLWWDEGWTLNVARNWVETGHYGHYLYREPAPPSLAASFPVVAPVALSFRLFGVGIWQGRLPGLLFAIGSLALIYLLAERLYGKQTGAGALVVLLFLPGAQNLHPLFVGRQVLGEMPAMFYLLGGYLCLYLALAKKPVYMIGGILLWGAAVSAKTQVLPFWVVSLLVPAGIALSKGWRRHSALICLAMAGAWLSSRLIPAIQDLLVAAPLLPKTPVAGLNFVTGFVIDPQVRIVAILLASTMGLHTCLGLIRAFYHSLYVWKQPVEDPASEIVRLALLLLAGSWFAWYILFGMFWPRYLFPAVFLGSIFTYQMIVAFSSQLRRETKHTGIQRPLFQNLRTRYNLQPFLLVLALGIVVPLTWISMLNSFQPAARGTLGEVVAYLNTETERDARIESYDSELFFLLERSYHFPPSELSVDLIQRGLVDPSTPIDYDPLAWDPDYLVTGGFSKQWGVYNKVLSSGVFHLVKTFPGYEIYARVR
jgi:hypothetical protein